MRSASVRSRSLLMKGRSLQVERKQEKGFSLTELVVAMAVAMILMGVGMPAFLRAYHSYQLNSAASQVAGILRLTRYEAIRRNRSVICAIQILAGNPAETNMWADSNGNGVVDPTENSILLGSGGNLVDAGSVPGTASLVAAAVNAAATATPSPNGSTITFDARGAVTTANVTLFYLNNPSAPEAGYRAVLLMPAGSVQIWSGDVSGNWLPIR
jgi:type IV fimbrial biogenesis protein FimT